MSEEVNVDVEYLTRVEGHGNIVVNAKDGEIEKCEWQVIEAPRFFESMVVGRNWKELHHITSRICGICSIAHTLCSLRATESAMDVDVSDQDILLRKLALHGENMQSHVLHLGYLVLPDFMGAGSVIPLASSHPEEVKTVIRVHRLANYISELIGGRTTHPQRFVPGGLSKIPEEDELVDLKQRLKESIDDLNGIADLLEDLSPKLPDFTRETEFISLTSNQDYAFYDGMLESSDTGKISSGEYLDYIDEYIVPQSTAKYAKHNRESYMVGALARLNNNYEQLSPMAKEVAERFDLKPVTHKPFMNNVAQLVEVVHNVEDSMNMIDSLLDRGLESQEPYHQPDVEVREGRGVGAVEAPRGLLIHDYTYDEDGVCTEANAVIPTNQNHANIQLDMEKMVPNILNKTEDEIELTLEMLVRAYDPCISCSTHYLDVEFVE
ncbi:hydrogenase/sulfur reductase subunit alpha [candidate division MSBL1 archaeon SCGC-AAA382M17]|uniref:Hydrogenase/sulfur reductase subunit alpha n=1 Tax=candidate division MSBL1 archaeon SCGC-AAA382M17 TaxID=1698284 RepID=A0ABR5TJH3_9EURY|nr:hydrogenase/sulfur reductase subunit alpha [candidate division MSBL1 archaeon SCGC-AAA382M17]